MARHDQAQGTTKVVFGTARGRSADPWIQKTDLYDVKLLILLTKTLNYPKLIISEYKSFLCVKRYDIFRTVTLF